MKKVVTFLVSYLVAIVIACELNAAAIIHDAVVGPIVVALIYSVLLLPAALGAVAALTLWDTSKLMATVLPVGYGVLAGIAVQFTFVAHAQDSFSGLPEWLPLVVTNCALVAVYLLVGSFVRERRTVVTGA
jgi:hypothetical protein